MTVTLKETVGFTACACGCAYNCTSRDTSVSIQNGGKGRARRGSAQGDDHTDKPQTCSTATERSAATAPPDKGRRARTASAAVPGLPQRPRGARNRRGACIMPGQKKNKLPLLKALKATDQPGHPCVGVPDSRCGTAAGLAPPWSPLCRRSRHGDPRLFRQGGRVRRVRAWRLTGRFALFYLCLMPWWCVCLPPVEVEKGIRLGCYS